MGWGEPRPGQETWRGSKITVGSTPDTRHYISFAPFSLPKTLAPRYYLHFTDEGNEFQST